MHRRTVLAGLSLTLAAASRTPVFAQTPHVGIVAKIGGIPWFTRMEEGIKEQGRKLGLHAFMVGPTSADPALQVRAIEDLIAQGVKAIGVVPNDAKVLAPVLQKAKNAGIITLSHESPGQAGIDWDFELATPVMLGEATAELLAKKMGGKGKYAVFVGSLTVPLHNAWADAGIAYFKKNYPEMLMVGERYGVAEDADKSRATMLDLMSANPDLRGLLAFGSQGPIGAGRAVEDRRKIGEVFVVGSFNARQGLHLFKRGAVAGGYKWNSKTAGQIFVTLADRLIKGQPIKDGDDIEGLGVVRPDVSTRTITVNGLLLMDDKSIDWMAAEGL